MGILREVTADLVLLTRFYSLVSKKIRSFAREMYKLR